MPDDAHGKPGQVDWNDLLVRESIPGDYGTIRPSETDRDRTDKLKEKNADIVQNFN